MNREKLLSLVTALRVRTVENGCTEAEAFAAAEKLAELLDRYHQELPEGALTGSADKDPCETMIIPTQRKQRQPIDIYLPALAALFDCRLWMQRDAERKISYGVFGLPESLHMVATLDQIVRKALADSWESFRKEQRFIRQSDDPKGAFQFGMASSLAEQIFTSLAARQADAAAVAGRAVVVARKAVVEQSFETLGLQLKEGHGSGRRFDGALFQHGEQAAGAVDLGLAGQGALPAGKKGRKSKTPGF